MTLSVILFVAAIVGWGRSFVREDRIQYLRYEFDGEGTASSRTSPRMFDLSLGRGGVCFFYDRVMLPPSMLPPPGWIYWSRAHDDAFGPIRWANLTTFECAAASGAREGFSVRTPYWSIAAVGIPLPLIAVWRWRKKRRVVREGLCPVCGYDLRASPDRCPECGTDVPQATGVRLGP